MIRLLLSEAVSERRKNRYVFVTSEDFRLRLVIGHRVFFFTREKNRTTNQIAFIVQRIIFILQLILEYKSQYSIIFIK